MSAGDVVKMQLAADAAVVADSAAPWLAADVAAVVSEVELAADVAVAVVSEPELVADVAAAVVSGLELAAVARVLPFLAVSLAAH